MSFYAVTPGFVSNCKALLLSKGFWDYDYSRFEALSTFEMSPLEDGELVELSDRIVQAHAVAFKWDPEQAVTREEVVAVVQAAAATRTADRARHTIREVVKALDRRLEDDEQGMKGKRGDEPDAP